MNKLSNPTVTGETVQEFSSLGNEEKSDIKDVGGFAGGYLRKP